MYLFCIFQCCKKILSLKPARDISCSKKIKTKNIYKTLGNKKYNNRLNELLIIIEAVLTVECSQIINKIFFCFKQT